MALCFSTGFLFEAVFSKDLAQRLNTSQGAGFTAHWTPSCWKKYSGCSYPEL